MKKLVTCVFATLATVACSVDPGTPEDHMKIFETCLQTECAKLQASQNQACAECSEACFNASYDCDPDSACEDSCSPADCSDTSACAQQGYQVVMANNPSADVAAACNAELAAITACGYTTQSTSADCDRYAAVELASTATYYSCAAALPCTSLTDANALAACSPAPSTLGDDFCAALASACPSDACTSSQQTMLDAEGSWLRQDAMDALQTCLSQPSCDETSQCISAWITAVE